MQHWSLPGYVQATLPNLFGRPASPGQISFGQTAGEMSASRRLMLDQRMASLSVRMRNSADLWQQDDTLADPFNDRKLPAEENPRLPAGYAYLLQLIAHDLTDTGVAAATAGAAGGIVNGRTRPLLLDTIYGFGPDTHPWAYEPNPSIPENGVTEIGRMPRDLLRTDKLGSGAVAPNAQICPFRDIARSKPNPTDPLIADPRNDAHALMSQMTVLFHLAHNALMHRLDSVSLASAAPEVEVAYRKFNAARTILTLIYRRILRNDVLKRILHPAIWTLYHTRRAGKPLRTYAGVPVECSHGAFRFAHSLVRGAYRFNMSTVGENTTLDFLTLSSRRGPTHVPLSADWMVDWALFFDMRAGDEQQQPQFSQRIGPHYAEKMESSTIFKPMSEGAVSGLAHRDFKSAIYAGQWAVPAFIDEVRSLANANPADFAGIPLPAFSTDWKPLIEKWLRLPNTRLDLPGHDLTAEDAAKLAVDPPWPFFVLFEAAFRPGDLNLITTGMGQHLGVVGSFAVAETIFGALDSLRVMEEEWSLPLKVTIAECCNHFLGKANVLPELTGSASSPPETMSGFLRLIQSMGAVRPA